MSPVLQAPGLDSPELTVALLVVAVVALAWGFERYRTTFSKAELAVSVAIAVGVALIALVPDLFSRVGALFNIQQRPLAIALVANVGLIFLVLLLFARTRTNQVTIAELTRSLTVEQAPDLDADDERSVFIVIPAYNEAGSVHDVVASLPATLRDHTVVPLVVSDGSSDDTASRAEDAGAVVVEHPINQGQGGALQTGFEVARAHNADVVVTMDADGQHPVDQLEALVSPVIDDEADYVVGSRFIGQDRTGNGLARQSGIRVFTQLINAIAKLDISDCTNGFRAIRGSSLDALTLTEERFSAPELLIEARKKGLRIREIPVTIDERVEGETKKPQLMYALGLTRAIFVTWLR